MNLSIKITAFWPAALALIGATVLFCLPGEQFPQEDWFAVVQLDKWIHVGLLGGLVSIWCLPFISRINDQGKRFTKYTWIAFAFLLYGGLMEFIQWRFIPFRDFDVGDLGADAIGCGVGVWFTRWQDRLQRREG